MNDEQLGGKLLEVFGYTKEDLKCADNFTAMHEIFEQDSFSNPITILELFIYNCNEQKFTELKQLVINKMG